MTSALIVEGGALRSVFCAGVLDGFVENRFNPFELYLGVSAGAANIAMYLAGLGRSLEYYSELVTKKQFISLLRFLRGGHFIDIDWIYNRLFEKINASLICNSTRPFYIVLTQVDSGMAEYVRVSETSLKQAIIASSALPYLYKDFPNINGQRYTDGGISDATPIAKAIHLGATRIMLIRVRPKHYQKSDTVFHKVLRWRLRAYPELTGLMRKRVENANSVSRLIGQPPPAVHILEICPSIDFSMGRFNNRLSNLKKGYLQGRAISEKAIADWDTRSAEKESLQIES